MQISKSAKWLGAILCAVFMLVVGYYLLTTQPTEEPEVVWTPTNSLREVKAPTDLRDLRQNSDFEQALLASREYYAKQKPDREYQFGSHLITSERLLLSLDWLHKLWQKHGWSSEFYAGVAEHFQFFSSAHPNPLFTGYYEPELAGSLTPDARYRFPIYQRPDDLYVVQLNQFATLKPFLDSGLPTELRARLADNNRIVPYYDRNQIDYQQQLAGRNLELLWVDDQIDLFFLQIQGSGRVRLPDNSVIRIGYADKNGQPYRAIGKLLLERGIFQKGQASMQAIKKYLRENPAELKEVLNYNPSYVFFRKLDGPALGSIGQPVTAFRSIATDSALFPKGALAFIELSVPQFDDKGIKIGEQLQSFFVFNQDTGGAIKSPGRIDLFTGFGAEAELIAGHLSAHGRLYFLAPKN